MSDNSKRLYEAMFLVDAGDATSDWDGVTAMIDTLMQRAAADVVNVRKWDERRLTYEVAGRRRGTYILSYFRATPDAVAGLERDVQLNERILRVLVLRGDQVSEEQINAETPAMKAEAVPSESTAPETTKPGTSAAPSGGEAMKPETSVAVAEPDTQPASAGAEPKEAGE